MMADVGLIEWLLFESEVSANRISRESGVPLMTVSDLRIGKSHLVKMRLYTAIKLTEYAREIKKENC